VGDIRDEYDTEEAPIQDLGDGRLLADAAVSIHDLSAYLALEIPESSDYESLGGLLIHQAGKVPPIAAQIVAFGLSFIVREADEKRISKVEIIRPGNLSEPAPPLTGEGAPPTTPEGGKKPDSDRKIASAAT
jgi:CBS domain containing-hemolysin-like protein